MKDVKKYDADAIMRDLIQKVEEAYKAKYSLREIARELDLSVGKVTKLLVTAGAYNLPIVAEVAEYDKKGKSIEEIRKLTGLSKSSINNYLPYTRNVYNAKELSRNAERIIIYRKRKAAVKNLRNELNQESLWATLKLFEGYSFVTYKGLRFKYTIAGGEIFIDRKEKSITKSSVWLAYEEAKKEMDEIGYVSGPKKLKTFGASYLYSIFIRFGLIEGKAKAEK